jgi:hypothetical protein
MPDIISSIAGHTDYNPGTFTLVDPGTRGAGAERSYGLGRFQALTQDQDELNKMLLARAAGTAGPSVAETQLRTGLGQGQRQNLSLANSARGMNRVGALRGAIASNATMAGDTNAAAATLRANEQVAAQNLAAQNLGAMQGQNISQQQIGQEDQLALLNADVNRERLRQQTEESNAQRRGGLVSDLVKGGLAAGGAIFGGLSDIRAKEDITPIRPGMTDDRIRALLEDEPGVEERRGPSPELLALLSRNRAERDADLNPPRNAIGLTAEQQAAMQKRRSAYQGRELARPLVEAWSTPEQERTTKLALLTKPEGSRAALEPVEPYTYQYKPDAAAKMGTDTGTRAGVMAHDIERSPLLADAVIDTPDGKVIDGQRALSANLALAAGMDKRLKKLEGKRAD